MLDEIFSGLFSNIMAGLIVVGLGSIVYFSADIYMILTKKDFGRVNVNLAYFTKNDKDSKSNALHFRTIEYRLQLMDIYRNRFMLWKVLQVSMRTSLEKPVLDFGSIANTKLYLSPLRGIIAHINSSGEFNRACGQTFTEVKFQIVMVKDRPEEDGRNVLKAVIIRDIDLRDFDKYLDNPPTAGKNFELVTRIATAFKESPHAFLPIQIVLET